MSDNLDLRIIKTRAKLRETFAQMMSEMTFDEISVFDLCARAGVRRATFYKHFHDKQDFLSFIVSSIEKELKSKICGITVSSPIDYYAEFVERIVEYFEEKNIIILRILKSASFPSVFDTIIRKTLASMKSELKANEDIAASLPADIDTVATFINGGVSHLLVLYLINGSHDKENLISSIRALLNKFF